MTTWKLSINTDAQPSYTPFDKCRELSLLGIGWHHNYIDNEEPRTYEDAQRLVREMWGNWPSPLKNLLEVVAEGDHVWLHKHGTYYLCKVKDWDILYASQICEDYNKYDLGHARRADWVEIPEKFVSGKVQRGVIAQRTIQRIKLTNQEADYNKYIFNKLKEYPKWNPEIDTEIFEEAIKSVKTHELFSLMTPDDMEDVVAGYLQSKDWLLIKSTCFRSKPRFEFALRNKEGKEARVQVKTGQVQLNQNNYKKHVSKDEVVYLFSTADVPFTGDPVEGVCIIQHDDIRKWVISNLWALTLPLTIKLWLSLVEIKNQN